jgi:diguanylate cyclase (GGDEF)-like protein
VVFLVFEAIQTNIICITILLVVFLNFKKQSKALRNRHRYFFLMLWLNVSILTIQILRNMTEGYPTGLYRELFTILNIFYFIVFSLIIAVWCLYVNDYIHEHRKHFKIIMAALLPFVLTNTFLAFISPSTGILFSVDAQGYYQRGTEYSTIFALSYIIMFLSILYIVGHRMLIPENDARALLLFTVPPMFAAIIQIINPEISILWPSMTISVLIVYVSIQSQLTSTDPLTGVYNRREYERYIKLLPSRTARKVVSAVMIDINDFKQINDEMSHQMGDLALREIGDILKRSVRKNDFVARIGGDEFCIIIESDHDQVLFDIVKRIEENIRAYNRMKDDDFPISLSMGYGIYDDKYHQTFDNFFEKLDRKMYLDKQDFKQGKSEFA